MLILNLRYIRIILLIKNIYMAKRGTTLSPKRKSKHSHKTKKRLEIKRAMIANKATTKRRK